MKILITGSAGYIWTELIKHISDTYEIVTFDIKDGQDILRYEQLKDTMKWCDIVVHLAAIRWPDETRSFQEYFDINGKATLYVAQACVENGVKKLIYTSSTGYYGVEVGIPYIKPIKESNAIISQHVGVNDLHCRDCDIGYSTSKVIAEQVLANFGLTKKLHTTILRLWPIGGKLWEKRSLDGITLKIENTIQAIQLAIESGKEFRYEAFTITDEVPNVDISKAKSVLGYEPL